METIISVLGVVLMAISVSQAYLKQADRHEFLPGPPRQIPNLPKPITYILLLAFVPGVYFGVAPWASWPPFESCKSVITISNNEEGTRVCPKFTVKGTESLQISDDFSPWLVMQDDDGDHYEAKMINLTSSGEWQVAVGLFDDWYGRQATILIVQVEGRPPLNKMLEEQEDEGERPNVFDLPSLGENPGSGLLNVKLLEQRSISITNP